VRFAQHARLRDVAAPGITGTYGHIAVSNVVKCAGGGSSFTTKHAALIGRLLLPCALPYVTDMGDGFKF
jgi:hypothetical protein